MIIHDIGLLFLGHPVYGLHVNLLGEISEFQAQRIFHQSIVSTFANGKLSVYDSIVGLIKNLIRRTI